MHIINSVSELKNLVEHQNHCEVEAKPELLCDYFLDSLVDSKKLNSEQRSFVATKIPQLISLAAFNLGIDDPLASHHLSDKEIHMISEELNSMTLAVKNHVPLYSLISKKSEILGPMIQFLLSTELPESSDLMKWEIFETVFIHRNEKLMKEARDQVQELFLNLYDRIQMNTDPATRLTQETVISYLLCLYPYFAPKANETLSIPHCIDGKWRLCKYKPEAIQLTPSWMGSPIYAYGLQGTYVDDAGSEKKAPPTLLFKGTTYPTDDGAFLSLCTDFNPFGSVGEYAFNLGTPALQSWFERATDKDHKAYVSGLSLGGSLVLMACEEFREFIELAYAYNPAALREGQIHPGAKGNPKVRVIWQDKDLIECIGWKFNPDWDVISILGGQDYGSAFSHSKGISGEKDMMMVKLNTDRVNDCWSRKVATLVHGAVAIPTFLLLCYAAYRFRRK